MKRLYELYDCCSLNQCEIVDIVLRSISISSCTFDCPNYCRIQGLRTPTPTPRKRRQISAMPLPKRLSRQPLIKRAKVYDCCTPMCLHRPSQRNRIRKLTPFGREYISRLTSKSRELIHVEGEIFRYHSGDSRSTVIIRNENI